MTDLEAKDWWPLVKRTDDLEGLQQHIAKVLRSGQASELFLKRLAGMFDPLPGKTGSLRASLSFSRRGQPRGERHDPDLGAAMIAAVTGLGRGAQKAAKADVAARFRVSLRTAEKAMAHERWAREMFEWLQRKEMGD